MSMKDLVVCKFAECGQVYNDARILPCGKRTCAAHIDDMVLKNDNTDNRKMLKCHFCQRIHTFPEEVDEFPADETVSLLLNIKHCSDHEAAKTSFNELSQLLNKLIKLDQEDFVIDYFERVEANILVEKEVNMQKLIAFYQKLVDDLHERKVKCLHNLKTNKQLASELDAIRQTLAENERKLKQDNVDFALKTLDGNETKWKAIQSECNTMLEATKLLGQELNERIVGDQLVEFRPSSSSAQI